VEDGTALGGRRFRAWSRAFVRLCLQSGLADVERGGRFKDGMVAGETQRTPETLRDRNRPRPRRSLRLCGLLSEAWVRRVSRGTDAQSSKPWSAPAREGRREVRAPETSSIRRRRDLPNVWCSISPLPPTLASWRLGGSIFFSSPALCPGGRSTVRVVWSFPGSVDTVYAAASYSASNSAGERYLRAEWRRRRL
jgi:hypothetical protein